MKKNNKVIIGIVAVIVIVGIGVFSGYYFFVAKTSIELFDYVDISIEGVDGEGKVTAEIPKDFNILKELNNDKKLSEMLYVLDELIIDISKTDGLSNGDEVIISIDSLQPSLVKAKIKPATTKKSVKIDTLPTVIANWDDLPNKQELFNEANKIMLLHQEYFQERLENDTFQTAGVIPNITTSYTLETVRYGTGMEDNYCLKIDNILEKNQYIEIPDCGEVLFFYKITRDIEAPYYYENPEVYAFFVIHNIYVKNDVLYYDTYSDMNGDKEYFIDFHTVENMDVLDRNNELLPVDFSAFV